MEEMGLFDTKEGWISCCCFSVSSSWTKDDEEKHLKPKKEEDSIHFLSFCNFKIASKSTISSSFFSLS